MKLLAVIIVLVVFGMVFARNPNESKYCKKCEFHTMCKTSSPGALCKGKNHKSIRPTKQEKRAILDSHNILRNRVAMGMETRGNPGPQFEAANMMKMEWDNELANIAQREADQCYYDHDCKGCRTVLRDKFSVGQNIAIRYDMLQQKKVNFTRMIENWYTKEVDGMDQNYANRYVFDTKWSHYSQLVWWNSRLVGCAAAFYDEGNRKAQLFFCNYHTGSNVRNSKMYEVGLPASQCPKGTAGTDPTYKALCVIKKSGSNRKFHTDGVVLGFQAGIYDTSNKCEKKGFRLVLAQS